MIRSPHRVVTLEEFEAKLEKHTGDHLWPRNLEAEAAVLGAALLWNEAIKEASAILEPKDFFRQAHGLIFEKMIAVAGRGEPVDLITLKAELARTEDLDRVGGPAYIASLVDGLPRATNVTYYAGIVREQALRRNVIALIEKLASQAREPGRPLAALADAVKHLNESVVCGCNPQRGISEPLPDLLERMSTVDMPLHLVNDLIPGDGIVLLHSQPREFKSLVALALALSVTTGIPAFGLRRLLVPAMVPAWYITEEDSVSRVAARLDQLSRGLGVKTAPDHLHVSAGLGISLDTPDWQEQLIAHVRRHGFRLVVLDPLRSLTAAADQSPKELKPLSQFLRRFIRETGAVVLIVHHDTKPSPHGRDTRRSAQRASGGGIFSIADCPIHVERVDPTHRTLVPSDYKFQADPPPILLEMEQRQDWLRLVGSERPERAPASAGLDDRILRFLSRHPNTSSSEVVRGARGGKQAVLERLKVLAERRLVASVAEGQATLWRALCDDEEAGSAGSPVVPEPLNR